MYEAEAITGDYDGRRTVDIRTGKTDQTAISSRQHTELRRGSGVTIDCEAGVEKVASSNPFIVCIGRLGVGGFVKVFCSPEKHSRVVPSTCRDVLHGEVVFRIAARSVGE